MPNVTVERNEWNQIATLIFGITGDIRYGKVEITIHDARLVQLEVTEKFRLPEQEQFAAKPGARPATR